MESFNIIIQSLGDILSVTVLLWLALGCAVGILFGALPGLTATTGVAVFLPVTFYLPFNESMAFLLGIFCGGYYAGSIPAILIKTPGAPGNAPTALEGYPMANRGEAGKALALSVSASCFGGIFSALCLLLFAPAISKFASQFSSAEYFSVTLLGLVCVTSISRGSIVKGIASGLFGLLLSTIGMDPIEGVGRFTFGNINLMGGMEMIPCLIGVFALHEVLARIAAGVEEGHEEIRKVEGILKYMKEVFHHKRVLLKSSVIGTFIGALPGTGPTIAAWLSYGEAQRSSQYPEKYGQGTEEGIIAVEAANNAVTGGAMIPLLTLGIPGDAVTAILLGALMIQGLVPGPNLLMSDGNIVYRILWLFLIGYIIVFFMGILASKFFGYIIRIPFKLLNPLIVTLCVVGAFASRSSFFDVKILLLFGGLGYVAERFGFPVAPIILGLVLGPILEPNFRRTAMTDGGLMSIFTRPISLAFIIITIVLFAFLTVRSRKT